MRAPRRDARAAAERAETERRAAIDRRREAASAALPPEAQRDSEAPTALLRVRLPVGTAAERRFDAGDSIARVYEWVDSLPGLAALDYVVTSTFPRREYPRDAPDAAELTLAEAGLVPNAALMIVRRDD